MNHLFLEFLLKMDLELILGFRFFNLLILKMYKLFFKSLSNFIFDLKFNDHKGKSYY